MNIKLVYYQYVYVLYAKIVSCKIAKVIGWPEDRRDFNTISYVFNLKTDLKMNIYKYKLLTFMLGGSMLKVSNLTFVN